MDTQYEVLIVDDNPGDVRLLEIAFQEADPLVRVRSVADGEQAIDYMFRRGPYMYAETPNLVLLDLNLPKVNGHEVLRELKANDETRFVPVVILTSSLAQADLEEAYSSGANSYMVKRYDLQQTIDAIRTVVRVWLYRASVPPRKRIPQPG